MQYSLATLAVLATGAMAGSTLYITEEVTITSCGPTVTDCPAQSTVVSITSYPVVTETASPEQPCNGENCPEPPAGETETLYETIVNTITSCAPTVTDCPYGSLTSTIIPVVPTHVAPAPEYPTYDNGTAPVPEAPTTLVELPQPTPDVVTITIHECTAETPAPSLPAQPEQPCNGEHCPPTEEQPEVPVNPAPSGAPSPSGPAPGAPYPSGAPSPSSPAPSVPYPSGTGVVPVPHPTGGVPVYPTGTVPQPPSFTGAASGLKASGVLAFAGVLAAIFV